MTCDVAQLIDRAWNDHAADPAGVAARLETQLPLLSQAPEHAAAFTRLAEHVLVGHLGDAGAMDRFAAAIAGAGSDDVALARARLSAALLRGSATAPAQLRPAAIVGAHGVAACGQASRGDADAARRLMQSAQVLARESGDADALKALAASHHNLAAQIEDGPRSEARDALMMDSATASRSTWAEAGTWVHIERADHMLALCALAVGDTARAVAHAQSCVAICEANDADAFERFFAHEALARAAVAAMRALANQVPGEDRARCESSLRKVLSS